MHFTMPPKPKARMQYTMPLAAVLKNCTTQTLQELHDATCSTTHNISAMNDVERIMANYYAVCDLCKGPNVRHAKVCAMHHNLISFLAKEAYEEITTSEEVIDVVFTLNNKQVFTLDSNEFDW